MGSMVPRFVILSGGPVMGAQHFIALDVHCAFCEMAVMASSGRITDRKRNNTTISDRAEQQAADDLGVCQGGSVGVGRGLGTTKSPDPCDFTLPGTLIHPSSRRYLGNVVLLRSTFPPSLRYRVYISNAAPPHRQCNCAQSPASYSCRYHFHFEFTPDTDGESFAEMLQVIQ